MTHTCMWPCVRRDRRVAVEGGGMRSGTGEEGDCPRGCTCQMGAGYRAV